MYALHDCVLWRSRARIGSTDELNDKGDDVEGYEEKGEESGGK